MHLLKWPLQTRKIKEQSRLRCQSLAPGSSPAPEKGASGSISQQGAQLYHRCDLMSCMTNSRRSELASSDELWRTKLERVLLTNGAERPPLFKSIYPYALKETLLLPSGWVCLWECARNTNLYRNQFLSMRKKVSMCVFVCAARHIKA